MLCWFVHSSLNVQSEQSVYILITLLIKGHVLYSLNGESVFYFIILFIISVLYFSLLLSLVLTEVVLIFLQ